MLRNDADCQTGLSQKLRGYENREEEYLACNGLRALDSIGRFIIRARKVALTLAGQMASEDGQFVIELDAMAVVVSLCLSNMIIAFLWGRKSRRGQPDLVEPQKQNAPKQGSGGEGSLQHSKRFLLNG